MAESTSLEIVETGEKSSHFRYAKMKTFDNHTSKSLNEVVKEDVEKESILIKEIKVQAMKILKNYLAATLAINLINRLLNLH